MKKIILIVLASWLSTLLPAQNIVQGEYFFDTKMEYGSGTPITVANPAEEISSDLSIPVATLPEGLHRLFIRFKDSNNQWSQTENFPVFIKHTQVINIVAGEYFFDDVGPYGSGAPLDLNTVSTMAEVMQSLPTANLPEGIHRLFVRFQDSAGRWSQTLNFNVFIKHQELVVIVAGEYFFNELVPFGAGFPMNMDSVASVTSVTDLITIPPNLPPGTNTMFFRFKDSNGLWSHTFQQSFTPGTPFSLSNSVAPAGCGNNCEGRIELSAIGDNGPFTYDWSNGGMGNLQTDLCAGNYFVTVTDAQGCVLLDSFTVSGFPSGTIALTALANVTCNGLCNGSIDIVPNGGTAPYTYSWSNGSTDEDQSGLCSGMYTVTLTDASGCSAVESYSVTEPPLINVDIDLVENETDGQGNGAIDITVNGGVPPYTFEWSNGSTAEDLAGLSAGAYDLTLTDSNGCLFTLNDVIVDNIVGISNTALGDYLQIFPNPTRGLLYLDFNLKESSFVEVTIYDDLGRTLFYQTHHNLLNNQIELSLSTFTKGLYLLKVRTSAFTITEKIVVIGNY